MTTAHPGRAAVRRDRDSVSPLELFFDLAFVFALTQVTATMAHDLSGTGLLHGVLVVALLWWAWIAYSWLGNVVLPDEGPMRLVILVSMAVMFVLALAIPEAFDDHAGGLSGPLVVALCYAVFRALHFGMFLWISSEDPGLRRQLLRWMPGAVLAVVLLLAGAAVDDEARTGLWALAVAADYGGTVLAGAAGWRLRSVPHFAERHGLIVLVALGESLVAIGVGVKDLPLTGAVVLAALLGVVLISALWWAYFDVTALLGEHALAETPERIRPQRARDLYSFLHLPLVLGIVLLALGLKKVLEYVGGAEEHDLGDSLSDLAALALVGGAAMYVLSHALFKRAAVGIWSVPRLSCALLLAVFVPVAAAIPSLLALAVVAGLVSALVTTETLVFAEQREIVRHGVPDPRD